MVVYFCREEGGVVGIAVVAVSVVVFHFLLSMHWKHLGVLLPVISALSL